MLQGITIVDFTTLLPGPYATMMLADLGAEVINVLSPNHSNMVKEMVPQIGEESVLYVMLQRNKTRVELDLKSDEGRQKIRDIIESADVVIEGFRPGVMKRLGLDYETVITYNESIIYCSLTGYGHNNSMSNRAGHDINYQALSGLALANSSDNLPQISSFPIADLAAGSLHSVIGVLAAIIHRFRTGKGQFVDVSMTDASVSLGLLDLLPTMNSHLDSKHGVKASDLLGGGSFYSYYKTSDDRYFAVGSIEPKFFISLLGILGLQVIDYPTPLDQQLHHDIAKIFEKHTFTYWQEVFQQYDICVEPVMQMDEIAQLEFIKERELIVPHNIGGQYVYQLAHPIKYSGYTPNYNLSQ